MTNKGTVTCEQGKCRARTEELRAYTRRSFWTPRQTRTEDKTKGKKRSDQKRRRFRTQFNS